MLDHFKQLYRYRALIAALVGRHLKIRYRGSLLGFLWSMLNPLCLMLVYTLVFKYFIRFDQVEHYTVFVFCGLLPWLWFSSALSEGASSIASSGHLITKSMFPAQVLPFVVVSTSLVNYLLSLPLLFVFMFFSGSSFSLSILLLPFIVLIQFVLLYGLALALAALNVFYRDIQHLLGNLLTLLFFLTPITYPVSAIPERFRTFLQFNPLAALTSLYHSLIIDGALPSMQDLLIAGLCALLACFVGQQIYQRKHEGFAEML